MRETTICDSAQRTNGSVHDSSSMRTNGVRNVTNVYSIKVFRIRLSASFNENLIVKIVRITGYE